MLRTNWQNETKFCIPIIIDKIYVGDVNHCFSQICNRLRALDWCQNLVFTQCLENELTEWDQILTLNWFKNSVFAPYLKNEWTEFNQILYTHYYWQELQICTRVMTWLMSELVQLWTAELAALDYFKILSGSQVSDLCPLGYLLRWAYSIPVELSSVCLSVCL